MSRGFHSAWWQGTAAERGGFPTASLAVPFFWYETDTRNTYQWDGVAWLSIDVGGSGAANQVAYWTGPSVLAGDAGMTYVPATDTLSVGNMILPSLGYAGLGPAAGRLVFEDTVGDEARFEDCTWVGIENILYHIGDADTYLIFSPDFAGFRVGNLDFLYMAEHAAAQDEFEVNPGGVDIDTIVQAVGVADALVVRGSDGQITLGVLTQGVISSDAAGVLSVTAGSAIVGSGAANRVAYWSAANTLTSDAGLLVDPTNDMYIVADGGGIGIGAALERIEFHTAGHVAVMGANFGVGIAAPTELIHAQGAGAAKAIKIETTTAHAAYFEARDSAVHARLQASVTAGFFGTISNHPLDIVANNTIYVRVGTGGTVGIPTLPTGTGIFLKVDNVIETGASLVSATGGAFAFGYNTYYDPVTPSWRNLLPASTGMFLRMDGTTVAVYSAAAAAVPAVTLRAVFNATGHLGLNGVAAPSTALDIGAGAIELNEMAAPGAGAANTGRLYLVDNAGKTELYIIFQAGAAQLIAAQP